MEQFRVIQAVRRAGGTVKVAEALGVRAPSVSRWIKLNRVPSGRVLALEALSGVSRLTLRPDLYPLSSLLPPPPLAPSDAGEMNVARQMTPEEIDELWPAEPAPKAAPRPPAAPFRPEEF